LRRQVFAHTPFAKFATAFVPASMASTPPTEVDGIATIQGFATPRTFDNGRLTKEIWKSGVDGMIVDELPACLKTA
jgi:hypothetical protein